MYVYTYIYIYVTLPPEARLFYFLACFQCQVPSAKVLVTTGRGGDHIHTIYIRVIIYIEYTYVYIIIM